jgi:hypothetical protein
MVIHAYRFYFRQKDGVTYTEENVECIGTDVQVVTARQCSMQLATLKTAPFALTQGDSVWVRIVAINSYGESPQSEPGNNAVILNVPDAPIELANVPFNVESDTETTTDQQIRFTWVEGANNGGTPVLNFDVYYNQGA